MSDSTPYVGFTDLDEPGVERTLSALAGVLSRHPIAAQAAFHALASEGRSFATTAEGAALREALSHSKLLTRIGTIWEVLGKGAFIEDAATILPSVFLEGVTRAASDQGLEVLLSGLFDRGE